MNEQAESWKRLKSKKIADCRVFQVREDFCERETDGKQSTFYCLENPDWVNVIALTETKEIVLIEQYRHGAEEFVLEIPGGMIDENEAPEAAAKRELLEETGFTARDFIFLGKSHPNPAIQNNALFHFLAVGCEKTQETEFDEHESVITKLVALDEVKSLIRNGKITHSLVIAAFHFFRLNKDYES
jgi:8-oxo-dGTP pyrophosphatase MutT (NUDIX family)